MVKTKYIIISAAILMTGIVVFFVFWQSEEARVKKKFKELAQLIEKANEETKLLSAAKAKNIKEMFTPLLTITAPAYDFSKELQAKELSTLVITARAQYTTLALAFHDMMVDFPADDTADVSLTGDLKGRLTTGEYVEDIHELRCVLKKLNDTWFFNTIELVEVLEK